MAFAKGAFQGYNNMRQQERDFEYQMLLEKQKGINAASKIEAPQMFQIFGQDSSGSTTTYDLFNLAEKDTFGTDEERAEENLIRFYNTTQKPIKEVMPEGFEFAVGADTNLSVLDYFRDYDTQAFSNSKSRHDGMGQTWVDRNTRKPTDKPGSRVQYKHGSTFSLSKGHPFDSLYLI